MTERDYSETEINVMVIDLLTVHFGKLKQEEINFLSEIETHKITQEARDRLVRMFDNMNQGGDE